MNTLILYDKAIAAVAECATIDEAKDIADKNSALIYYGKQSNNMELEIYAAEIKLRAVRRMGEICTMLDKVKEPLFTAEKTNLPRLGSRNNQGLSTKEESLKSAGISTQQASIAERIAAIPESDIETYIAEKKDASKPVSVNEIIKKTAPKKVAKRTVQAKEVPEDEQYNPADDELKELAETVSSLAAENESLRDRLSIASLGGTTEDKDAAKETIESLREKVDELEKEVWKLKNEVSFVTTARDYQMKKTAELQSQINYMKRQAKAA